MVRLNRLGRGARGAGSMTRPPIETDVTKWRNVSGVPIFDVPIDRPVGSLRRQWMRANRRANRRWRRLVENGGVTITISNGCATEDEFVASLFGDLDGPG